MAHLQTVALPHAQAAHPHVSQQHLAAGVGDEVTMFGSDRQLQTRGVAPVLKLIRQQLHGHLLVSFVRLIQEFISQLAKFPVQDAYTRASSTPSQDAPSSFWDSPGIVLQILKNVVHQFALGGLVSHSFVQLASHQGLGHGLLPVLPQEQGHLLALGQHSPNHQLVEWILEPADLWVVHVDIQLLLLLLCFFPSSF